MGISLLLALTGSIAVLQACGSQGGADRGPPPAGTPAGGDAGRPGTPPRDAGPDRSRAPAPRRRRRPRQRASRSSSWSIRGSRPAPTWASAGSRPRRSSWSSRERRRSSPRGRTWWTGPGAATSPPPGPPPTQGCSRSHRCEGHEVAITVRQARPQRAHRRVRGGIAGAHRRGRSRRRGVASRRLAVRRRPPTSDRAGARARAVLDWGAAATVRVSVGNVGRKRLADAPRARSSRRLLAQNFLSRFTPRRASRRASQRGPPEADPSFERHSTM